MSAHRMDLRGPAADAAEIERDRVPTTFATIDPRTDPRWAELVAGTPGGLFLDPRFLDAVAEVYGFPIEARVEDRAGRLVSGVAYCLVDDPRGSRLVSLPYSDCAPPVLAEPSSWGPLSAPLLAEGRHAEFRSLADPVLSADPRLRTSANAVVQGLDLTRPLDLIRAGYHAHTRRHLSHQRRSSMRIAATERREHLLDFFGLHLGVRKQKYRLLAQPIAFFLAVWERFVDAGNGTLIGAFDDGTLVAGALVLVCDDTSYYKFAASAPVSRRHGANHAVADGVVGWAHEHDSAWLDFGRSDLDQPGLVQFKARLGASEQPATTHRWIVPSTPAAERFAADLSQLSWLLTGEDVPDHISARAGEVLYKYFA